MAVQRSINPIDDKEIVMVVGKVERIKIVEAEQTAKNIEYGVTHTASIVVDNQWINYISLGIKEGREPNIAINTGTKDSPKWVQIEEGDDVKVIVSETVKGDKTYYNAKRTGIKLVKKGAGGSSGGSQGGQASGSSYQAKQPFDQEGTATGHAVNGAFNFLITQGVSPTNENIIKYGKMVHNVSERINTEFKEKYEKVSKNYKAMTGNAVLNACKFADVDNFEQSVFELAIDFLDNVVPEIAAHVKGEVKQAPPAKITRAAPAKKAATKAAPVVEEPQQSATRTGFDDMDDDVPFANPMRLSAGLYLAI